MRMLKTQGLPFCLMAVLVAFTGFCEKTDQDFVISEGLGALVDDNVASARDAAIQNALSLALEQHLGVTLTSERVADNYVLRKSRIESQSQGAIQRYEVEREQRYEDAYFVKLKVWFQKDFIQKQGLDQLKVGVVVLENPSSESSPRVASMVESEMKRKLQSLGLKVDGLADVPADFPAPQTTDPDLLRLGGRTVDLAAAAKERGWDLVITAFCSCNPKSLDEKIASTGLKKYETRITDCIAKDPRSDETLANVKADAQSQRHEGNRAIRESAEEAAREAAEALVYQLGQRETVTTAVFFILGIENQNQLDLLAKYLKGQPGVREVNPVSADFSKRSVRLEAKVKPETRSKLGDLLIKAPDVELKTVEAAGGYYLMRVVE